MGYQYKEIIKKRQKEVDVFDKESDYSYFCL